ncbi:MAG: restriction endonuclease [Rhizobiaceae bacterium]
MKRIEFQPREIRYIKLGRGNCWAEYAFTNHVLPIGYPEIDHSLCLEGRWDEVRNLLLAGGRKGQGASQGAREIREFYELDADTLWVTIADGHLSWTFAAPPVDMINIDGDGVQPARVRKCIGGWRREGLNGEALNVRNLSSALTRTAGYRATICKVKHPDYLLRLIRGEPDPVCERAERLNSDLVTVVDEMIRGLHWRDFEVLVDLLFARSGWRRVSVVGRDMPDVDLVLEQTVTGEIAWVQIKAEAGQADLEDNIRRFKKDASCDRFFFACHSPRTGLAMPDEPYLHLLNGDPLAQKVIDSGLFQWVIDRKT